MAHESQHGKAVKSHADVLALLETDLPEEELDEKVLEAEKLTQRTTCTIVLRGIRPSHQVLATLIPYEV